MTRWPDPRTINGATAATFGFEYNVGIVLRGIQAVYERTGDARYLAYIQQYVDAFVNAAGTVNIPAGNSFDNIEPSNLIVFLYNKTGATKYSMGAQNTRARYDAWPRNAAGGFWHKDAYPNEMWLDSIFMGEPFLANYGAALSCGTFCRDTVVQQITLIATHVRDATTGLLYHAWDQDANAAWADPTTGRAPVIWSRALGWYAMSLVDILPTLPAADAGGAQMLDILRGLAVGLKNTQDPATGLWFQVVDKGTLTDNWVETSGSGMFVYALRAAIRRGYIDASFQSVADAGWRGMQSQVTNDAAGLPVINNAVQGMGVQINYANYVNKTRLSNSSHGLCAILLAASEMEAM